MNFLTFSGPSFFGIHLASVRETCEDVFINAKDYLGNLRFFFLENCHCYPYHVTGLFLYPLKTSQNLGFSDVFRGYKKRPVT